MEEKKSQPENVVPKPPPSEITVILKSMLKEEASPPEKSAAAGTPLNNLKNILVEADKMAQNKITKETLLAPKVISTESPRNPAPPIFPQKSQPGQLSDIFSAGPVVELDALIKAHRANSPRP